MGKKVRKSTKQVKDLSRGEELTHYVGILMEDMESKFNMVIEKVDGLEENLARKMDARFAEQDIRFDRIEFVLGQHGDTLKEHSKILNEHSNALERLETKFDTLANKVDEHDKTIHEIQQHVFKN